MKGPSSAVLILLFLSFIGIDVAHVIGVIKTFPFFLFVENLVYAGISLALLWGLLKDKDVWCLTASFGSYLTGRVSRSVITPYGTLPKLALQHVPLLALSLALALLGLWGCYRRAVSGSR
ncbi:hypothetical protein [Ignicoccus hospitalis]|uniref:Uncharacterized protein n=1 Tax=Ignicoccus hospitalis (strain KIN4/I / DSM 18386 / JCM 14125) TaxID=453591 RepID=A8A961_IGNH4|nr:hypothetical protein [Ignicoccus hospitalis]ABU81463.1 hypothetical protein Igni_0279 [Ignicoccus hospitalis KIN4/I]HIH90231.1 hypothetical protein [Desulfurococcaceae archaeon]